ncbi:NAD-dependent epimerase/dehydratase family protein [Anoxybacillus rupiensis]|jgi:nucleoside-diphosphate-sugar epimerase|uniref:NAD-dependent epimerase/dehydratase family protein n=1 Tax=Anoxybacteroides rupiense TaxID=311460 RepID=A0ABT5W6T2_9BACL|nr:MULTISPECIES: NAD-dependent epimerase/dehydratase family protein [Anoxybacillus]MDE8565041.1 NAD-dependent epimerase/dehydratase family protein [Anoxybacillus rupiensis]QHC03886.1 NAD-dependent epimerase/dehydratase family protein [Anoxybacillus sp. PDR2]
MKTAVVFGATGGMGSALVEALIKRKIYVIAVARSKPTLLDKQQNWGNLTSILPGDAMNLEDVEAAVAKGDMVFHAINLPYQHWDPNLAIILSNILEACRIYNKPFVYVDNIYSYGLQSQKTTEASPKKPHTKKGKLRLKLLEQIEQSSIPYLIVHFPDFYGPNAGNTLLHFTFQQMLKRKMAFYVGDPSIQREFIYIKDGAEALVELSLRHDCFYQSWNIPGAGTISGKEIAEIAGGYLNANIRIKPIYKWMIQLVGMFNPFMREYAEMMYLNEKPVILDGGKYEKTVGPIPQTPYAVGIKETLKHMQS